MEWGRNLIINDKQERICKEDVVACLKILSWNSPGQTEAPFTLIIRSSSNIYHVISGFSCERHLLDITKNNLPTYLPTYIQTYIRGYLQKFPDRVDNEIYAYNNKHSRSNTKCYGGKPHWTDSQNSDTTAPSDREL
jgi:hypothetical protein